MLFCFCVSYVSVLYAFRVVSDVPVLFCFCQRYCLCRCTGLRFVCCFPVMYYMLCLSLFFCDVDVLVFVSFAFVLFLLF